MGSQEEVDKPFKGKKRIPTLKGMRSLTVDSNKYTAHDAENQTKSI